MSELRRLAGLAGAGLALGAALAAVLGLAGAVWAWPDALNHFAPVWLCAAWAGGLAARFLLEPGRLRGWSVIAAAVAVLVAGAPIAVEAVKGAREPTPGPVGLTLLTFNRWWESPDTDRELAMIRASGADLVTLQEAETFVRSTAALKDLYPYQLSCGRHCDTAILSKRPFLASGSAAAAHGPGWTDFLWVRVTAPDGRPVTVATIHLFWPIPPWIQGRQRAQLVELAAALPRDELILAGDLNLTPWSFALRELDSALAPLTRRTRGLLTFPATWPAPFLAPDQVYAAPPWKTVRIQRLPRSGSDHYPVLVQLRR